MAFEGAKLIVSMPEEYSDEDLEHLAEWFASVLNDLAGDRSETTLDYSFNFNEEVLN